MQFQNQPPSSPFRIALTGGPGAGKTQALTEIQRVFGERVAIIPESATLLYSGGFPRFTSPAAIHAAQRAIFCVQRNLEEVFLEGQAEKVLLCDRGTVDGAAYWPEGTEHFFKAMHTTHQRELERYSAVLFLESATMQLNFVQENNTCRTESPNEAITLDKKLRALWEAHPQFRFIPRQKTLEQKLALTIQELINLLPVL